MGATAFDLAFGDIEENALVKRDSLAIVKTTTTPQIELSTHEKALRDEKWLYCKLVVQHQQESGSNRQAACYHVAATKTHLFPLLVTTGKKSTSALTYNNCRHWLGKLTKTGKGKFAYNWENKNALVNNWGAAKVERYGDPAFWRVFYASYLNRNHWSVNEAYKKTASWLRKQDVYAAVPSINQVRHEVGKLNPLKVNNSRLGPAWVRNNMLSYIDRTWDNVMPNQVWFADHRVSDFWIKVWNKEKNCYEAKRPWMCVYFDAKSWHVISVQIMEESPAAWSVRNGLALGIKDYGRPDTIYVDNGRDFLAQGFGVPVKYSLNESGSESYEHSILKALNIGMINSIPYNGRAKCVERFFGYISRGFDRLFPGYLSNKADTRSEHAALYSREKNAHLLPNQYEMCELFSGWLEEYHNTPINGKIHQGQSPAQVFAAENRLQRAVMSKPELCMAFLKPLKQLRKVQRGPSVFVGKTEYRGDERLWPYFEKKIMVKTDGNDLTHLYAFEPNGKLICECKTKPAVPAIAKTDAERLVLESEMALQRRQSKLARVMVLELTGNFEKLDALTLYSMSIDQVMNSANLRLVDGKKSVKGGDHNPKIYLPAGDPRLTAQPVTPVQNNSTQLPFKQEVKTAEQMAFERKLDQTLLDRQTEQTPQAFILQETENDKAETQPVFVLKDTE